MMDPRCHETREMAADLALGIVEGEERGRALQHLADCPDCRAEVGGAALVMNDGRQLPLNWFHLDPTGSSGGGIPVDPHNVSFLRLLPGSGGEPDVAHFTS